MVIRQTDFEPRVCVYVCVNIEYEMRTSRHWEYGCSSSTAERGGLAENGECHLPGMEHIGTQVRQAGR